MRKDLLGNFCFLWQSGLLLLKMQQKLNPMHTCWYFDDGITAGTDDDLRKALEILTLSGAESSLGLRNNKCELRSVESLNEIYSSIKSSLDGIEVVRADVGFNDFTSSCILKCA